MWGAMTDPTDWIFVCTESWMGSWRPLGGFSPHTSETYTITPGGTWVPSVDFAWLTGFRKACPCKPGMLPVQIVHSVNPTEDQLRSKPDYTPRIRKKYLSVFGLESAEPDEEEFSDEESESEEGEY